MRKHFILFSAIVMAAALATGCGNTTSTSSSTPAASQTESSSETEITTKELVEINPFESVNKIKLEYGDDGASVSCPLLFEDKTDDKTGFRYYYEPYFDDKYLGDLKAVDFDNISSSICHVKIFAAGSDGNLCYGDELVEMAKNEYGVILTETEKDLPWEIKGKKESEIDPFEGIEKCFNFKLSGNGESIIFDGYQNLHNCDGCRKCKEKNASIDFDVFLGDQSILWGEYSDLKNNLHEGDVLTIKVNAWDENDNPLFGDEVNEYLAKQKIPVKLNPTEKEVIVSVSDNSSESSETEETAEE